MFFILRLLGLLCLVERAAAVADCACGYTVTNADGNNEPWIFTEAIETDFTSMEKISSSGGWQSQQFNVSAEAGRGNYGKAFSPANIMPASVAGPPGHIAREGDPGVDLVVGSTIIDGSVPVAEMDTVRQDIIWGSFRAGMKLTSVKGTCAAFFWYFNDTQEIDMEFLSREYDHAQEIYPVNLVIQSRDAIMNGYDASQTGTYKTVNLTFDPSKAFHEYRFDYLPGKVYFYADSQLLAEMEGKAIPDSAGHLILQHWSNGNPKWSGGPPKEAATVTVSYVQAYFNSSDKYRHDAWQSQCKDVTATRCLVPNVTAVNATDGGIFLTNTTEGNKDENSGAENSHEPSAGLPMLLVFCIHIFTWLALC